MVLDAEVTLFCSNFTDVSADEEADVAVMAEDIADRPLVPSTGVPTIGVPTIGEPTSGEPTNGGDRELTTSGGDTRDTVPLTGGGVSGSGKVTSGSPSPGPPASSRSSSSSELRSRLLNADIADAAEDRFFISLMLDLSSDRSDFMEEAFISEEVTCTRWEDEVDVDILEEEVEADVEICGREISKGEQRNVCTRWDRKSIRVTNYDLASGYRASRDRAWCVLPTEMPRLYLTRRQIVEFCRLRPFSTPP